MTQLLFLCSRIKLRSPTAEAIFSGESGFEVMSAGVNPDAENRVTADDIDWADGIFVMEASHRRKLTRMFGSLLRDKRLVVLGIPDDFAYMDPELVAILNSRVRRYLSAPMSAEKLKGN